MGLGKRRGKEAAGGSGNEEKHKEKAIKTRKARRTHSTSICNAISLELLKLELMALPIDFFLYVRLCVCIYICIFLCVRNTLS